MSRLLTIDLSTAHGSLAVVSPAGVEMEASFDAVRGQSSGLFPALAALAGETPGLDAILVGLGPGSFAGLRVAIAAADGFGRAAGLRLFGLPSALGVRGRTFAYAGDARRGSWHYTEVTEGRVTAGPELLDPDTVRGRAASRPDIPLFGPAELPGLSRLEIRAPQAGILGMVALTLGRAAWISAPLEPLYLRGASVTRPHRSPRD